MGQRLGQRGRVSADIERIAQWWAQANQESRFVLLQRVVGSKTPQEGDPSLAQLQLAILLAEAEAGEVDQAG